ncbi:MAG: cation transporter [Terriglobales bacterium]
MASPTDLQRSVLRLQTLTLVWMSLEAGLSLFTAYRACSIALLGFGGDSGVELLSALLVVARFLPGRRRVSERMAGRLAGALLFAVAGLVVVGAGWALSGHLDPAPSRLGMAVLLAAALFMPWLARKKRRLAVATGSVALRADAMQSSLCAYLAWIALAGLLLNARWSLAWADPAAGLLLVPLILKEGREAWRGNPCGCC